MSRMNSRTLLQLEILEARYTPAVQSVSHFSLVSLSFVQNSQGQEVWQGVGGYWFDQFQEVATNFGVLSYLGEGAYRITTMPDAPAETFYNVVSSRQNGWVAQLDSWRTYVWNSNTLGQPVVIATNLEQGATKFNPTHVSNQGMVSGMTYDAEYHPYPAFWTQAVGIQQYSIPSGTSGYITGGSQLGSFMAGAVINPNGLEQAALFRTNGPAILLESAGFEETQAIAVSENGRYVAGVVKQRPRLINGVYNEGFVALCVWVDGKQQLLRWYDGVEPRGKYEDTNSAFMSITDDGYLASSFYKSGKFRSILWHPSFDGIQSPFHDAQEIASWYQAVTGEYVPEIASTFDLARSPSGTLYLATQYADFSPKVRVLSIPSTNSTTPPNEQLVAHGTHANDIFYIDASLWSSVSLDTGNGDDLVLLENNTSNSFSAVIRTGGGHDGVVLSNVANVQLDMGAGNDRFTCDQIFHSRILTGDGNDVLLGTGFRQVNDVDSCYFDLGKGNDLMYLVRSRNSTFSMGSGNDTVYFYNDNENNRNTFYLGNGNDQLDVDASGQYFWCGAGNDSVRTIGQRNIIRTEAGNDTVVGDHSSDYIDMGLGNDSYSSYGSSDIVLGRAGNDTFRIDSGTCTVFGESGHDAFYTWNSQCIISGGTGVDRYFGLNASVNTVDLGGGTFNFLFHQEVDRLVRNPQDIFSRPRLGYLPLSRREYLDLMAPFLTDLQSQNLPLPLV